MEATNKTLIAKVAALESKINEDDSAEDDDVGGYNRSNPALTRQKKKG